MTMQAIPPRVQASLLETIISLSLLALYNISGVMTNGWTYHGKHSIPIPPFGISYQHRSWRQVKA